MTDWNNKEEVLKELEYEGYYLEYASEELKSDREFILSAVKKNGSALEYASKELKADKEVVLAAVKQDGYAFSYASKKLKKDKEIFDTAKEALIAKWKKEMLQDGFVSVEKLEHVFADDSIKSDRDIVMAAVQADFSALDLADKKFRSDREVVMAAVQHHGFALCYADEKFRSDREVVMAALQSDGTSLQFADEVLRSDREFILEAIEIAVEYPDIDSDVPPFFYYVDEKLKSDREVVLAAVKRDGDALEYVSKELRMAMLLNRGLTKTEWDIVSGKNSTKTFNE